jgi:formylmethanofuran dehydrogenase subunit E
MRIMDHGKVAATFVDTLDGRAIRVSPRGDARERALLYASDRRDRWHAQLDGYYRMPAHELLVAEAVTLSTPLSALLGRPGVRVTCDRCGEEVMNCREVATVRGVRCRTCSVEPYFEPVHGVPESPVPVRASRHDRLATLGAAEVRGGAV